jgi:hypothetical protein
MYEVWVVWLKSGFLFGYKMGFLLSIIVGVSSGFLTSKEFALGFKCLNLRGDCLINRAPSYFQKFTRFQMHEEAFEEQRKLSLWYPIIKVRIEGRGV